MVTTNASVIKQIKGTNNTLYDLNAKYWNGYEVDDLMDTIHGAIDTYVIPAQTSNKTANYTAVVESTAAQVSTTKSALVELVSTEPSNFSNFKVGDIILMGATSDGKINFDRWVSKVEGDNITLDVLETQVATHHHKLPKLDSSNAITGVTVTSTKVTIPAVGTAVNVLTSAKGTFVTSVAYSNNGSDGKVITHESGTGSVSHSHTVNSHNHSITFNPKSTLVSRTIDAVTSVTSKNYTPHTHTSTTVATAASNGTAFTYVTGISQTDTFVKTLKQTSTNTGAASGSTGGSGELTTSTQVSTDTIGDVVKTKSAGAHKHTVTAVTTTSVVTAATVAASVVTSVSFSFTPPTVQANVVTSVTKVAKTVASNVRLTGTKTFMSTWSATVTDGVLSFTSTTATVDISFDSVTVSGVGTITSGTQSSGTASLSAPRSTQSRTYGAPTISVTCTDAGEHQHGFSHTHKIAAHSHSLGSHTHTYDKATVSTSADAVINLTTGSYTPHTHSTANVIATATNSTAIQYLDSASSTAVIRDLKDANQTLTTTDSAPGTNAVYTRLSGTIKFPGISAPTGSVNTASASINPAVAGTEQALESITLTQTSKNFVTGYSSNISTTKTGGNVGGN